MGQRIAVAIPIINPFIERRSPMTGCIPSYLFLYPHLCFLNPNVPGPPVIFYICGPERIHLFLFLLLLTIGCRSCQTCRIYPPMFLGVHRYVLNSMYVQCEWYLESHLYMPNIVTIYSNICMRVIVCMYVCMYVCTYVRTYVCMYVSM